MLRKTLVVATAVILTALAVSPTLWRGVPIATSATRVIARIPACTITAIRRPTVAATALTAGTATPDIILAITVLTTDITGGITTGTAMAERPMAGRATGTTVPGRPLMKSDRKQWPIARSAVHIFQLTRVAFLFGILLVSGG
jgi:hypothetical protein